MSTDSAPRFQPLRLRSAAVLASAFLAAGAVGLVGAGPVGAEGNDFTATCQPDGTYLVAINYGNFVADSYVVNGVASLSIAYTASVPMSPTNLPNVGDTTSGSTSIPGTTSGALQIGVQMESPNGSSGGFSTIELAGDCAVAPAVTDPAASDPGTTVEAALVARAIVAVPRTAG